MSISVRIYPTEQQSNRIALDEHPRDGSTELETHDQAIVGILNAIRELMNPPAPKSRPIGFTADLEEKL